MTKNCLYLEVPSRCHNVYPYVPGIFRDSYVRKYRNNVTPGVEDTLYKHVAPGIGHHWRKRMPTITLPDGTQKKFTDPVTIQQVAESVGPGLAKAPGWTDQRAACRCLCQH